MLLGHFTLLLSLCCGLAIARPSARPRELPRRQDGPEQTPMCGRIIDAVNKGQRYFYAADAYECLTSVPFHEAMALRFIDYYNTTMQFQSTLAYLKDPPEGYQQPAFDLMQGLEDLKKNVTAGVFKNQYDFEATLQYLVYSVHDAHVDLFAGVLSAFSFASPWPLVTASIDGKEIPKVYFASDVINRRNNITKGIEPYISAVSHINGRPAMDFLTDFAALQSVGMLEPHADWNELMDSPVQDIHGVYSIFAGESTFYPGKTLNFTCEDQTVWETSWTAIYNNPEFTGPLTTGGDFYNFFVLGLLPASYEEVPLPVVFGGQPSGNASVEEVSDVANGTGETGTTDNWNQASYGAFPKDPDIVQFDLGLYGGGIITGYFYDDISTGVISIPHFEQYDWDFGNFSQSLADFMDGAKARGLAHIIVDVQKNYGGSTGIALLLFRELFPGVDPFTGSQRRSHELGNVLGSSTTSIYERWAVGNETQRDDALALMADEWVITTKVNAGTGVNFTSWEEYQGPRQEKDENFSLVEEYDLKNPNFHAAAFDGWILNRYLDEDDAERKEAVWAPEDVVILTDGTCSSACAIFVELATTQGGARTVVVGGAPKPGPMQAASGTRGMRMYYSDDLDIDISWARNLNETANARLPANRKETGIYINYAGFNLRDQLREDDVSTPLQFRYAAADCRLYFTLDNVYNMSALWHDVARAAFEDPSLCVEGSTGYTSRTANGAPKAPPSRSAVRAPSPESATAFTTDYDPISYDGLPAGQPRTGNNVELKVCDPNVQGQCPGGQCKTFPTSCSDGRVRVSVCTNSCAAFSVCEGNFKCDMSSSRPTTESKQQLDPSGDFVTSSQTFGFCPRTDVQLCGTKNPDPVAQDTTTTKSTGTKRGKFTPKVKGGSV
ncbi:Peptidase S41 family protein ustP [Colletotrichum viniferum]|nr:Peptidase S41 family protein ustP [Colletotrichum viniferum]